MKRPSLPIKKLENKHFLAIWIIFHISVLLYFSFTFLNQRGNLKIDADLFNMLPKSFEEESIRMADEKLTEATGQNVFILVANKDFSKAKKSAEQVYNSLKESSNFNLLILYNDMGSLDEVVDYLFKYRWNMLDEDSINQILSEGGKEVFAQNALAQAYSPFTMLPLDNLDQDPFMLTETNLNHYLDSLKNSGTAMSIKDGVLASQKDDVWYIMLRGILSKKGAALASKNNGITEIYDVCSKYENDGTRFVYSGTPFHSHESSNSASIEITVISSISMLIVVIMLIIVFRSVIPLSFSVGSIILSVLSAVLVTISTFHKLHMLTLVFGTSLIGSCIDYSVHYFTHWSGNAELKTGKDIRNHLLPGLVMAIFSSVLCFGVLLFAPFNLLKQMALFSISGLISSFLTTISIYPYIPLPKGERKLVFMDILRPASNKKVKQNVGRIAIVILFVFSISSILILHNRLGIKNDVSNLYTIKGTLLENEKEAGSIIQYNPSGWFIVRGETEELALEEEENLRASLNDVNSTPIGYISTSLFIPSIETQKKSRMACKELLDLAEFQLEALGYDASLADSLRKSFEETEGDYISFSNGNIPQFLLSSISSVWLGEINDAYYTVLMPNIITDSKIYKNLCSENDNVYFINKMADLSSDLDHLTKIVLEFFAFAYIIMFFGLRFFYNWKQTFKIISIPLLIILMTLSVFTIANIKIEFFTVTGLVLVFGLGLDYIIYMMENEKNKRLESNRLEPFATMLSFGTTVISFGALALSSFKPVHYMGLSIFLGITTAYVSSMFYDRSF